MDDTYDVIVLGTGLKECILSGLMSSCAGKKVLHLDRNSYYGGESASLNLEQLWKRFRPDEEKIPSELGKSRDYCVDLCPKFLMACGNLVKILLKTQVTSYLEFRSVAGSYVVQKGKPQKVPSTPKEALGSSLLSMFQRVRFKSFITFVGEYDESDTKTHKGLKIDDMSAADVYKYFKLEPASILFTGHAICLYLDDSYLTEPAIDMINRAQLYANSVARYGNSPYIYPKWGLGGLPEGFSRRCAVHGGVYMLNTENKDNFIQKIHYDDEGKVTGVQVGDETAKTTHVIGDPSYWVGTDEEDKVKQTGKVARAICIFKHTIPNTNESDSCQIIIPAQECDRKSDVYVCMSSYQHNIAAKDFHIAVCSANVERDDGDAAAELAVAIKLLGKVDEQFTWISEYYEPANDSTKDNCFITSSYDATTHFETCSKEVLDLYEQIMGEPLDLETVSSSDLDE